MTTDAYFDLGAYGRRVTTASDDAQRWFDRGLNWSYGFNHEEAVRCFERAAEADPACAMAQWGIAYASGPNYNHMWDSFTEEELTALGTRSRHRTATACSGTTRTPTRCARSTPSFPTTPMWRRCTRRR